MSAILALFGGLPLLWRIGTIAAVMAALVAGYAYWHHSVYRSGFNEAVQQLSDEDEGRQNEAKQGLAKVRDCRNRGGTWSVVDGVCH